MRRAPTISPDNEEIDALYVQLRSLERMRIFLWNREGRVPERYSMTIALIRLRLEHLQTLEAERHRREFEAGLSAPIGAGAELIKNVRALLG